MAEPALRTYRFEAHDGAGVFLGLGAVQCALLLGALLCGAAVTSAGGAAPVAVAPAALAGVLCFGRFGGQPLWEWVPLGVGWCWARATRRIWFARLPLLVTGSTSRVALPPCLAGLDIVDLAWRGTAGGMAAVRDRFRHTLTALVPVEGPQFLVADRAEQDRLLAAWADVLHAFCAEHSVVSHLTWSDLARQAGLHEHLRWIADRPAATSDAPAAASYRGLLATATATATGHDTVVSVTVARRRLTSRRQRLHDDPEDRLAAALGMAVEALLRGLRTAGITAQDPLDPAALRRVLRARVDPALTRPVATRAGRLADRLLNVDGPDAGPLLTELSFGHVRTDGALHRSFHIACWPRLLMPPSWLEPFLTGGGVTRTVTVVLAPTSSYDARRRIASDLVRLESDAATKAERGRRVDARHQRATQALLEREDELASGWAPVAYCGIVTVTAWSEDELNDACEIVEQLAREANLELRPLDRRHDLGWAASLPLGLAPRAVFGS